jgi:carbon-monoxide dehydrogenase small subunit
MRNAAGNSRVSFRVNGRAVEVTGVPAMERLLDTLRERLALTGSKEGCGEGECGACTVIIDGRAVNSCLVPICQVEGAEVITVEGLARDQSLSPLQEEFAASGGAQCGICTPGILMAARVLLDANSAPSRADIREGIAGNLCRCTGYQKIVDGIEKAAAIERGEGDGHAV